YVPAYDYFIKNRKYINSINSSQLVDVEGGTAYFEDVHAKERLPFSIQKENIAHPIPWLSTFAMIEEFDESYYFNGFWMGVGPASLQQVEKTTASLMQKTGKERKQVLKEFFPEITASLLDQSWQYGDAEQKIFQYITSYVIKDEQAV